MSGPEVTDVMMMLAALEGVHSCRAEFRLTTRTTPPNGSMHIECTASFSVLPGSDLPSTVAVEADWPSAKARTFEGLLYNLLWQLDYAIGKAYEQMTLKET